MSGIYTSLSSQPGESYGVGERILRTVYFEMSVSKGFIEKSLIRLYKLFAYRSCAPFYDEIREKLGLDSLGRLGADIEDVIPLDGKARIQMMTLSSRNLEDKIDTLGGSWKKVFPENAESSILAIIPPDNKAEEWLALESDLLRLKWKQRDVLIDGEVKNVIVTCSNADAINESDYHTRLFLHSNSASVTFSMLTKRWGFYLGCKQSICGYNPRGAAASTGTASEAGHYNDISTVYDKISTQYDPSMIWLTSACGGGPAAAYLKATHPELNHWIFENGFTKLQDCIDLQSSLARYLAKSWMGGLKSLDIPEEHKPRETGYDLESLFDNVEEPTEGTIVVAKVINDQVLSPEIYRKNIELARRVHTTVEEIAFTSTRADGNHHFDRYFAHPEAASKMIKIIFRG